MILVYSLYSFVVLFVYFPIFETYIIVLMYVSNFKLFSQFCVVFSDVLAAK